jgi:AraC-like DNA-binding protein
LGEKQLLMTGKYLKYDFLEVPSDLREVVKHIWSFESSPNEGDHFIFRTYANIYPSLFFIFRGEVRPENSEEGKDAFLLGQTKSWQRFSATSGFGIFGVTFYPFVLPMLFNIPSWQATDKTIDLKALIQKDSDHNFNSIINGKNNDIRLAAILSLLRNANSELEPSIALIAGIIRNPGSYEAFNAEALSSMLHMSRRQFERKFKYYSGNSPKSFFNVLRFQTAFNRSAFEKSALMDTTYELAYYDQAHFSNSFKAYSGFNPKQLAKPGFHHEEVWENFAAFFQFLSICPPVLCGKK